MDVQHSPTLWNYRSTVPTAEGDDLVGYTVDALDGEIGKVASASNDTDNAHFVVDTGFWIFGKQRLVPAGVVLGIDHAEQRVAVNMTKDQIKDAPDWDASADTIGRQATYTPYYGPYGL